MDGACNGLGDDRADGREICPRQAHDPLPGGRICGISIRWNRGPAETRVAAARPELVLSDELEILAVHEDLGLRDSITSKK